MSTLSPTPGTLPATPANASESRRYHRWVRRLGVADVVLGVLLLALVLGVGCGGSPNTAITNSQQSTAPGTYPVTIIASSAGAVQGSITFNITVTH